MMNPKHSELNASFENILRNSIEDNFEAEGRWGNGVLGGGTTHWERSARAKKQGGKTLQDTGLLAASIRVSSSSSGGLTIGIENDEIVLRVSGGFVIDVGSNRPYARTHQLGGQWKVPVTKKMRGYFWHKYYETKEGKWKGMALTNKTEFNIVMPPRPYLVVQDEDLDAIHAKYSEWVGRNIQA